MKYIYVYREYRLNAGEMGELKAIARDSKRAISKAIGTRPTVGEWYTESDSLPMDEEKARLIMSAIADDTVQTFSYLCVIAHKSTTDDGFFLTTEAISATSQRSATEQGSKHGYVLMTLSAKKVADIILALSPTDANKDKDA